MRTSAKPPTPLGARLAEWRKRAELTRAEVGSKLDVTEQAVGTWERGDRAPGLAHLTELTKLYGLRAGEIAEAVRLSSEPRPEAPTADGEAA